MTEQLSFGISPQDNWSTHSKTMIAESTQSSSIQMALVLQVAARTEASRFGIFEVRDSFNITMPTVVMSMKLISIQMAGTFCQAVQTRRSRYGIWDKATSCILSMAMRANQHRLLSLHVVITLQLVDLTLWSWFGKVILMRMNRSLSKTLVRRQVKIANNKLVVCLL